MEQNYNSTLDNITNLDQHLSHMPSSLIHHNGIRMAMNQIPVLFYGTEDLTYTITANDRKFSITGTTKYPRDDNPFSVIKASFSIDEKGNLIYKEASSHTAPTKDNIVSKNITEVDFRESKYSPETGIEMMRNDFGGVYTPTGNLSPRDQALLDVAFQPDRLSGSDSIRNLLKYDNCGITQSYRTKELLGIAIVNNTSFEKKGTRIFEKSNYGIYGVNGDVPARLQYDLYACFEENGVKNAIYKDQTEGLDYTETLMKYNEISINGYYTKPIGFTPHAYDLLNETYIRELETKASKTR